MRYLVALLLAGCGGEPPPPAAPPAPSPAIPATADPLPTHRGPAGEVPADSRRPFDDPSSPVAPADGYDYALPGAPGSDAHYHVHVRDDGSVLAKGGGGATPVPIRVLAFRVARPLDVAVSVRDALAGSRVLDPATAGGCGDAPSHVAPGTRPAPALRAVRARVAEGGLDAAVAAAKRAAGETAALDGWLGASRGGVTWLDVHLLPAAAR